MKILTKPKVEFYRNIQCCNCECLLSLEINDLLIKKKDFILFERTVDAVYYCYIICKNCKFELEVDVRPAIKLEVLNRTLESK